MEDCGAKLTLANGFELTGAGAVSAVPNRPAPPNADVLAGKGDALSWFLVSRRETGFFMGLEEMSTGLGAC